MFSLEISGFAIKTFVSAQSFYHPSALTPAACGSSYMGLHWLSVSLPPNVFWGLAKGLDTSQGHPREKPESYMVHEFHKCPEDDPISQDAS